MKDDYPVPEALRKKTVTVAAGAQAAAALAAMKAKGTLGKGK